MSGVKSALTRKFGPLPAWAWALIAGAAIYVYRTRKSLGGAGAQGAAQTDAPLSTPSITPTDPTGGGTGGGSGGGNGGGSDIPGAGSPNPLVGTDPGQLPRDPITIGPGERVYDPERGLLLGDPPATKVAGKRAKKPKPHHTATKAVPKGGHHKSRARSIAKTLTGRGKKGTGPAHNPKHGGKPRNGGSPVAPKTRTRAKPFHAPAQRQRPEPQHTSTPKPRGVPGSPGKARTPANPRHRRRK